MENRILNKKIQNIYHEFRYRITLKTMKLLKNKKTNFFRKKISMKLDINSKTPWNDKNWNDILEEVTWISKQLILKILTVEIVSKDKKSKKAGIDSFFFRIQ